MKKSADAELSRAVLALLAREPFFAHVLGGVERSFTTATATAGVTVANGRLRLLVNPDFLLTALRTPQQRAAVLKHEALHLVLRHIFRRGRGREPLRWNVACDLVVNQLVGRPWPLPAGAVTLELFPDLPADQTAERYYELLARHDLGAIGAACRHSDHSQWPAHSRDSAAGSPAGASATGASAGDETVGGALVDRLVAQAATRTGRGTAKGWGSLPAALVEAVEGAFTRSRPQLDWRRVVRLFGTSSRRTRVRSTYRRPSVRYGTLPGTRVQRLSRLAVAVDTSGSISTAELHLFFSEIHGIWRAGADVHVIECDAAVGRTYPYAGTPPADVSGRGGTAFTPVFEWLRATPTAWDGCVYLTDGEGPPPTVKPPCPVLWVVTAGGSTEQTRFGRAVRLA